MANKLIDEVINKRYPHWMDYAVYHASRAGIPDLAGDLLQEVLIMLLEKDEDFLLDLISKQKAAYTELDFYVLNLIKRNAHSPTSPFRYKEQKQKIDRNIVIERIELTDEGIDTIAGETELKRVQDVKQAIEEGRIEGEAKKLFEHRFFKGGDFSEYESRKTKKELHVLYMKTLRTVRERICGEDHPTNTPQQLTLF